MPPYFCAELETGRDVSAQYTESKIGLLQHHKFLPYTTLMGKYQALPGKADEDLLHYMIEVFVDDYISLAMAQS